MSEIVLKVENLYKQYRLGTIGTGTIKDDLARWWASLRGKEDPTLKIGEANDRESIKGDYVWALQDINFEVKSGEVLGIVGKNGAGKSTLLKILSKVTGPTKGQIKTKGRIASLLEVGTGFHPELTGRENIFLNGAILGMHKPEIKKRFDEIVAFSGIGKYIDTPVKRYSSGMYVRLAFAVAAHLEPEILIIDEVLAVGDAEFQKKCLGKMKDVAGEGRTVLFVSHNMGVMSQLCNKALLLNKGCVLKSGNVNEIIAYYAKVDSQNNDGKYIIHKDEIPNKEVYFEEIYSCNNFGNFLSDFTFEQSICLKLKIRIKHYQPNIKIGIALLDKNQARVFTIERDLEEFIVSSKDEVDILVKLPNKLIAPNHYSFHTVLHIVNRQILHRLDGICHIKVYDDGTTFSAYEGFDYGSVIVESDWVLEK